MDSEHMAIAAKENEKIKFKVWLQDQNELQVAEWRNTVNECLSGLTKDQANNLKLSDVQPKPIPKFVAAHLNGKELKEVYDSIAHILPTNEKYDAELKFIIKNYGNFRTDNASV